jgi:thiamine monophosphate kinase
VRKLAGFLAVLAFLLTRPLSAHHAIGATYLENAPLVRIEGTVQGFFFMNPHTYLRVVDDKMVDRKGLPIIFDVEWAPGGVLRQQGVRGDSFKAGDHIIVTGNPGRNASDHRLYLRTLDRPSDGFHTEQPFDAWPWAVVR